MARIQGGAVKKIRVRLESDRWAHGASLPLSKWRQIREKTSSPNSQEMLLPLWASERGSPEHARSLQLLAHECAHIEDLKRRDEAAPGIILRSRYENEFEQMFASVGSSLWEEYYACRRSAHFDPSGGAPFMEALLTCLDNNQDAINDAIRRYRYHSDLTQLINETHDRAMRALRVAAYLIGHYDGVEQDWSLIPEVAERLKEHRLKSLLHEMADELRDLWDRRFDWFDHYETNRLNEIAWDAYVEAGIVVREASGGGLYLDVPFTTETMCSPLLVHLKRNGQF